ncbi:amino acid adenylation domain-containing protein [Litoribaculum gwangyangense]|uniref:Amino acid adenylation domain-containing protein n=1 Tax=Litoribaculum gwangyangense TaxID=1130722 RepID=A0ABP9D014_9FLAO
MSQTSTLENKNIYNPFAGPEIERVIHTTQAQEEIWTACKLGGDNANRAYNESVSLRLKGKLNLKSMEAAFHDLIKRHESLRCVFSTDGYYMTIFKNLEIPFWLEDITDLSYENKEKAIANYLDKQAEHIFDLSKGPLINCGLIKISDSESQLVLMAHHIICDGWSIGIMLQELGILYSAYVQNKAIEISSPEKFSTYADEQLELIESESYKEIETYWLNQYKESVPELILPTDYDRPLLRNYDSKRLDFILNKDLLNSLKKTGRDANCSLVTTLLAVFDLLLLRLTGQEDIVVGLPTAGQSVTGKTHLVGHCVSFLPLRSKIDSTQSFNDYLKQRNSDLFDAYDHQQLSFGHLLKMLSIPRDPSKIPLIPVAFNVDLGLTDGVSFHDLNYKLISNPRKYEIFEIFLNATGTQENLSFEWAFNAKLFKTDTIEKMMKSFEEIIEKITKDSSKNIGQIVFQDFTSHYKELNNTISSYPKSTLHELFADRVEKYPDAIALEYYDRKISYWELGQKINQIAHYLSYKGLKPRQVVAISLGRSPELIASLFAILQCGASYVPIDVNYPDARLNLMIKDSNASFYIGESSKTNLPKNVISLPITTILNEIVNFPKNPLNLKVTTESPAYIIYTSGSTGKPKGVQVAHCNVINLIFSMAKEPGISAKDKIFSVTTISFDAMVMEIYLPLIFGASVVLVDEDTRRNGKLLLKKIETDGVTMMWGTPSIWQILIDTGWNTSLKLKVLIGGEPVPLSLAQELLARCSEVWNIYGPTETTVCCILTQISKTDNPITIGKPIANTQIYLLNPKGNLVKPGIIGEIAIAGDGVSQGYLNRPELNKERFITNPFENETESKMYLSGDLGKLLPSGQIQCLGRRDRQVKVRGYRIELEEIEHVLMAIEGVKLAVVLAENDILIAFIQIDIELNPEINPVKLCRQELTSQLPSFMVPNIFQVVDKIPTTENGKIDRKALLKYRSDSNSKKVYTSPRTENEKLVASIWKENLNLENIDVFSNFFEIGGHSIKAVKIILDTEKLTGKKIPLSSLFQYPTVEKFAELLETDKEIDLDCLVPIKPNGGKTPLFIVHGAGLNVLNFIDLSKHFDEDQPVYGLQGTAKSYDTWYESIEDMAAHYIEAIIKINPQGPYALAGFSFGGVVVFEMTRQLKEQEKKVIFTGLLDSYADSSYYFKTYEQKIIAKSSDLAKRRLNILKDMLSSWSSFKAHIKNKKVYLLKKYFGYQKSMTKQEILALAEFTMANNMVNKIADRYHLKPQDFSVDLFRSKDENSFDRLDPIYLGWQKAATKGITIHDISGNHLDILAPPNDKFLARTLQDILNNRTNVTKS